MNNNTKTPQEVMGDVKTFVTQNLVQLCQEDVRVQDGEHMNPDWKLQELRVLLQPVVGYSSMNLARSLIAYSAEEKVSHEQV